MLLPGLNLVPLLYIMKADSGWEPGLLSPSVQCGRGIVTEPIPELVRD